MADAVFEVDSEELLREVGALVAVGKGSRGFLAEPRAVRVVEPNLETDERIPADASGKGERMDVEGVGLPFLGPLARG